MRLPTAAALVARRVPRAACRAALPRSRQLSTATVDDDAPPQIGYLSEEHEMLKEMCKNFSDAQLKPIAGELDQQHRYPAEQIAESARHALPKENSATLACTP